MSSGILLQLEDELRHLRQYLCDVEEPRTAADDAGVYALVGRQIVDGRTALRLTQADLGALIGVSSIAVSRWETGARKPDLADIARLIGAGIPIVLPIIHRSEVTP